MVYYLVKFTEVPHPRSRISRPTKPPKRGRSRAALVVQCVFWDDFEGIETQTFRI